MSSDGAFLEAAASIGRGIAAEAIWHAGRCTWTGAAPDPARPQRAAYAALGRDLYGGTAGVGLFLARLAAATGDRAARRTAIGALRHAVGAPPRPPGAGRDGLYAGRAGIAWAAATGATLLGEEELRAGARAVVAQAPGRAERLPDLATGLAGAILGALALAAALGDPRLAEAAVADGDGLIRRGTVDARGWSWPTAGRPRPPHLCGVAHGAAGIGAALVELFAASGEARFRTAGLGAFAYERSWLDARSGTWPDLRLPAPRTGDPDRLPSPAAGTWCHGEAGIALTRLRARAVLGPGPHAADGATALATTARGLAEALPYELADLSLCHGAGGAADVLLSAAAVPGGRWRALAQPAVELGRLALERYAGSGRPWPCGTPEQTTPGLLLGTSGIGWLLLRLHDPDVGSPLAPWLTGVRDCA
jgi:lantibiotic modifying enzyme